MRSKAWILLLLFSLVKAGGYDAPNDPPITGNNLLENSVIENPQVLCGSEEIALNFRTNRPFRGKIFVKGFVSDSNCLKGGDQHTDQHFAIAFDQCGVRRERKINGVTIAATVIVSFHTIFITKVDRAYRISCFYTESTKTVTQRIDVSSLTTQLLENQISMPSCKYEILSGGPTGRVAQYARIGETVYHKWTCISELSDVYCMRVHSCTVVDGQGGPPVTVLDANGCQVDDQVLRNLEYIDDLSAGQEALAFKFADRSGLYFNCQIQLTLKDRQFGCSVSQPDCSMTPYGGQISVPASATEAEGLEDLRQPTDSPFLEHKSGYTVRPYDTDTEAAIQTLPRAEPRVLNYPIPPAMPLDSGQSNDELSTSPYFSGQQQGQSGNYGLGDGLSGKSKRHLEKDVVADFDLPQTSLVVFGLDEEETLGDRKAENAENDFPFKSYSSTSQEIACIRTSRLWVSVCLCLVATLSLFTALLFVIWRQRNRMRNSFFK